MVPASPAEQGTAAAQFNLGLMYANGKGDDPKDDARGGAVGPPRRHAQGYARAQFNLGFMYASGDWACPRTTPRRRGGTASPPSRATPPRSSSLGLMYVSGSRVCPRTT